MDNGPIRTFVKWVKRNICKEPIKAECPSCHHGFVIYDKNAAMYMPYCGGCSKLIPDAAQEYCGYCGAGIVWREPHESEVAENG